MKKYDKTLFILYKINPIEFYDSAIGIDNLSNLLGKTRSNTLRALNNYMRNDSYILNKDKEKLILLDQFILEGKKNDRKRHKRTK